MGLGAGAVLLGNYWGGNMGGYRGAGEGQGEEDRGAQVSNYLIKSTKPKTEHIDTTYKFNYDS